jgi:type IV secretory pathway ATPase VirB11/archaellum biosynthesis ATPase
MYVAGLIASIKGMIAPEHEGPQARRLRARAGTAGTEAYVDCSGCAGGSSMEDPACRRCIMAALSGRGGLASLVLERDLVREYSGEALSGIQRMASFCDDLRIHAASLKRYGCGRCDAARREAVSRLVCDATADPAEAARKIGLVCARASGGNGGQECAGCREAFASFLGGMALLAGRVRDVDYEALRPFIMPRISRSRVLAGPPDGARFLASYEVEQPGLSPPVYVALYELPGSLEKMYFAVPWEYAMDPGDLSLLIEARDRLLRRRPPGDDFPDHEGARAFFARHAREALAAAAVARGAQLEVARLDRLAAAFVKYTSGLGIMEDILADPHIQDAYVNAPVGMSPLHVVVDGEECTSNVYLSGSDVESMISRLRAISGRPFSEASPVLDMDLGEFRTRVSAIGSPLSRGLAYAFRRHKKTPWTLPQLICRKMLSPRAAGLLSLMVDGHASMLITGSRGAGKTSLLSALMLEIPQSYRILAIEDTPELPLEDMQRCGWKVQGIGTRAAVSGTEAEFQASDALRAALRLGESALVLGEVRGSEARALYEAMRVGASGNSVMGTIHGASCRDVLERVVHDIGVPPASFRATDAVAVCSTVRPGGSSVRERRLVEVAEVSKGPWGDDPEGAFSDLLAYDASADRLATTDLIETGRSGALGGIARRWGLSMEEVGAAAAAKGRMMELVAEAGRARPGIMEAGRYAKCANMFRVACEASGRRGSPDYGRALCTWESWFGGFLKETP